MNKDQLLELITAFDGLPENMKSVGDREIMNLLFNWVNNQPNNSPLRVSAFLLAHQGPNNFNAHIEFAPLFVELFQIWQEDDVITIRVNIPGAFYQAGTTVHTHFNSNSPPPPQ